MFKPFRSLQIAMDRPGGRKILSVIASRYARCKTGQDVHVFYDGVWMHRMGDLYVVDQPRFRYNADTMRNWKQTWDAAVQAARDFWYYLYQPRLGDTVLDVGAGVGEETFVFSKSVGPNGRVLSIEAHPRTFLHRVKRVEWNRLANVRPIRMAIADKRGRVFIEDQDEHIENAVSTERQASARWEVEAISLDELCREQQIDPVDFLKMNIEGAERLALGGMGQMIRRTWNVCVACHDFRAGSNDWFRTSKIVTEFLLDHRFRIATRPDDPRPWVRDFIYGQNTAHTPSIHGLSSS